jgi:D-alanyl-lipoteichoic acid acyltransferase DltB (MBOAT superfamily)
LAIYVNEVYAHPSLYSGQMLALATVFFAYQIYCDFSGYSDMAIGAARVMGFKLMTNFRTPYYSKSISEFWHRWHISLSTWFRDYLYIPLGGSRVPRWQWYFNLALTFTISGFWHGANWTYIAWGFLNGLYLCCSFATQSVRQRILSALPISESSFLVKVWRVAFVFALTNIAWVLFRAASIGDALYIYRRILFDWDLSGLKTPGFSHVQIIGAFVAIGLLEAIQLLQRRHSVSGWFVRMPLVPRWAFAYVFIFLIALFGVFKQTQFIYFQF